MDDPCAGRIISAHKVLSVCIEKLHWNSREAHGVNIMLAQGRRNGISRAIRSSRAGAGRSFLSRFSTDYRYQQYIPPPRTSWTKKLAYTVVGLSGFTAFAYYMWWPKHTFPNSVAKILRKGLWAESDRGEYDFQLALKYYIEALKHCDEIGMDGLSDEYTGIQLKMAEMYEKLDMLEEASFVYNEIATLYLAVLTASPGSAEARRIRDRDHRSHIIQKDLRIVIKLVEFSRSNPQLTKAILVTHLVIANDEVQKKLGPSNNLKKLDMALSDQNSNKPYKATIEKDKIRLNNNQVDLSLEKNPEAWEPFKDEFFNAMDLLSAICLSTGDLTMASNIRIYMTEWMLIADVEPHKVLLSQCNLGSLLYLQAEQYESQEISMRRQFSEKSGIEYSKIKDQATLESNSDIMPKIEESISAKERNDYNALLGSKNKCIELAVKAYEAVLEFAKHIPSDIAEDNNTVDQTVALATYGLGVVNLHLLKFDRAERYLRESRVKSKKCGYDELIKEIERELGKLFKEKKQNIQLARKRREMSEDVDIEMDIHLKK